MTKNRILGEAVLFDLVLVSELGVGEVGFLSSVLWRRRADIGFVHSGWEDGVYDSFSEF